VGGGHGNPLASSHPTSPAHDRVQVHLGALALVFQALALQTDVRVLYILMSSFKAGDQKRVHCILFELSGKYSNAKFSLHAKAQ